MFNADDYNDNIEYCRYIYEKNIELNLGLNSPREIQFVANNYLDEVYARRGILDDEVYDNIKLLEEVINKLEKKFRKFKQVSSSLDSHSYTENYKFNTAIEKKLNRNGGNLYSDLQNDENLDNANTKSR